MFRKDVLFLGHTISAAGIATDPKKIEAVKEWPTPCTVKEVRSFLGLTSYYRKFILNYADKAKPLHRLTEKLQKFIWTSDCQRAFDSLKQALVSAPILSYPEEDGQFILDTDASLVGLGAVLSQIQNGQEKVISYYSRAFSRAEKQYCVTRRELLAIISSLKHFHHYLYGRKILIRSDHGALRWLLNFKNPEGQMTRWFEVLASYDFVIMHRLGRNHGNADALSRRPCVSHQCSHCERVEKNQEPRESFLSQNTSHDVKCENNECAEQVIVQFQDTADDEVQTSANTYDTTVQDGRQLQENICATSSTSQNDLDVPLVSMSVDQRADPVLKYIIATKERNLKPKWPDISEMNEKVKFYWQRWDSLEMKDDILYYKFETSTKDVNWLIVIPDQRKEYILKQLHDGVTGGHLGVKKTLSKVRQRYFWCGLRSDVEKWCRSCGKCCAKKAPTKKWKASMQKYNVGAPFERVALDMLGPFPKSDKGNKYLLVVGDYFSKWLEAVPVPDQEAATVANAFIDRIVSIFGVPVLLHTDQGSNFESTLFKEVCRILGIQKTRTTPLHPQSDGMVERGNRTINNMIAAFVSENQQNWDENIYLLMLAYRSAVHDSTSVTPNEMMFGRQVTLPVELVLGKPPNSEEIPDSAPDYVKKLQEKIGVIHDFARNKLKLSTDRMKRRYDAQSKQNQFNENDKVWLYNPKRYKGLNPKLQSPWEGPHTVLKRINDVIYKIQRNKQTKPRIVHHDRLKPFHSRTD